MSVSVASCAGSTVRTEGASNNVARASGTGTAGSTESAGADTSRRVGVEHEGTCAVRAGGGGGAARTIGHKISTGNTDSPAEGGSAGTVALPGAVVEIPLVAGVATYTDC